MFLKTSFSKEQLLINSRKAKQGYGRGLELDHFPLVPTAICTQQEDLTAWFSTVGRSQLLVPGKYITSISQMVSENHQATEMPLCRPGLCRLPEPPSGAPRRCTRCRQTQGTRAWGGSRLSPSAQTTPKSLLKVKEMVLICSIHRQ